MNSYVILNFYLERVCKHKWSGRSAFSCYFLKLSTVLCYVTLLGFCKIFWFINYFYLYFCFQNLNRFLLSLEKDIFTAIFFPFIFTFIFIFIFTFMFIFTYFHSFSLIFTYFHLFSLSFSFSFSFSLLFPTARSTIP